MEYHQEEGSLVLHIDEKASLDFQKSFIKTDQDRIFGYMFYLIRKYFDLNQTEMGSLFYKIGNTKGLSKSAYSKIENGYTTINFDLIMVFSTNFGVNFNFITNLFYYLTDFFYKIGSIFLKPCGHFGMGLHSGYTKMKGTSKDYLYTDLKDYSKFIKKQWLDNIMKVLDKNLKEAKDAAIFLVLTSKSDCKLM